MFPVVHPKGRFDLATGTVSVVLDSGPIRPEAVVRPSQLLVGDMIAVQSRGPDSPVFEIEKVRVKVLESVGRDININSVSVSLSTCGT